MREIILDTETTGFEHRSGDRLVEIGCIELYNHIPTGQTFHVHINPERDMPQAAFEVHGLSTEFLREKPLFSAVAEGFLGFIADSPLIIHNASFDMGFINFELMRIGRDPIPFDRVIDTLSLARRRFPAGPNSLDALCNRFGIDNSMRTRHGALLDAELLADVYVELIGGRQASLGLVSKATNARQAGATARRRPEPLPVRLTVEEAAAHAAFIAEMGDKAIWKDYVSADGQPSDAPASS